MSLSGQVSVGAKHRPIPVLCPVLGRSRPRWWSLSLCLSAEALVHVAEATEYVAEATHTVGFWCCFVAKPLFFHALASRPFALLVAPFFTSAVAPGAKLSRPRHHALGGTSLAHRRCIPSSSRICRMFRNGPLPVCFIMSADEAVPSQGPQGRRPRADARPRSLRFGHVHQPGSRMHAVLVEGQRLATLPFAAPRC